MFLSIENSDRLLWLGRYSERVYTGLRSFAEKFDSITDSADYESKYDFVKNFCFDEKNPSSIRSSLLRAYDNAIVLRDEIGSETFAYVQLALYEINKAEKSKTLMLNLLKVIDNIVAFWGMADDRIQDEQVRGLIKLGKRIERVDLYARMNASDEDIRREISRMTYRITKTGLRYNAANLEKLKSLANEEKINHSEVISAVENLIELNS